MKTFAEKLKTTMKTNESKTDKAKPRENGLTENKRIHGNQSK